MFHHGWLIRNAQDYQKRVLINCGIRLAITSLQMHAGTERDDICEARGEGGIGKEEVRHAITGDSSKKKKKESSHRKLLLRRNALQGGKEYAGAASNGSRLPGRCLFSRDM